MSFPLEPTHLIAHLRAFNLATVDDEFESAHKTIKPLLLGLYHQRLNEIYFKHYRPRSPPIPYDLPSNSTNNGVLIHHQKRHVVKTHNKKRSSTSDVGQAISKPATKASKRRSIADFIATTPSGQNDDIGGSLVSTIPVTTGESSIDVVSKPKEKMKNPLAKLFQKTDKFEEHYDSDSSSGKLTLENPNSFQGDYTSSQDKTGETGNRRHQEEYHGSAATTIDEEDEDGQETDDFDAEEEEDDNLDQSSSDSAFTDIEADSMIGMNSSMLYDYTVPESYVLQEASKKQKRRKSKPGSESYIGKSSKPTPSSSLFSKSSISRPGKSIPLLKGRGSFSFEKMYSVVGTKNEEQAPSNLSLMIQSRFKSTHTNPLNYFAFANPDTIGQGARKVKIDIFVPPKMKPVLKTMEIGNNVAIHDCIGFVLFSLAKLPEYKENLDISFMNPNHWRMELIDEDGELYDSTFGVLDRTRLLASYNSPNCLALCKVANEVEITSNERQSPLPLEFKQNLEVFQKRLENAHHTLENPPKTEPSPGQGNLGDDTIEVKVENIPNLSAHNYISFFISSTTKVGDLLELICKQRNIDPSRYELAEVAYEAKDETTLGGNFNHKNEWKQGLSNTAELASLDTNRFKLVPNLSQVIRPMTNVKHDNNSFLDVGITPTSTTFISTGITPPRTQLEGRFQELAIGHNKDTSPAASEIKKETRPEIEKIPDTLRSSNRTFGDLIHSKNPQLPTSLNTIYFKWKVFRKKPPILNRIEKSLIIDGDYIHLAPTDNTNWKKNPYENPFSASNQNSHHHHHYLHHYNYSKYYNDSMMKTSSFHITQIIKVKHYLLSKNPNHFKIVIKKQVDNELGGKAAVVKKKYDLEAESVAQCEEIIQKINWTLQVYNMSNLG